MVRRSRRSTTWPGPAIARPISCTGRVPPVGNTVDIAKATYTNTIGSVGTEDRLDRPRFRTRRRRVLLRARAGNSDTALDDDSGQGTRHSAAGESLPPPCRNARGVRRSGSRRPKPHARQSRRHDRGRSSRRKGAVALTDAQLNELIVGKNLWVRNNVTGGIFRAVFKRRPTLIRNLTKGRMPEQSEIGAALKNGLLGIRRPIRFATARSSPTSATRRSK